MAEDLHAMFSNDSKIIAQQSSDSTTSVPVIDIGITKEPYFTDKANCIAESNIYTPVSPNPEDVVEQVHITGFDTLTRIFTSKYYPNHDPPLSALAPFLSRHRIHATIRVESSSTNDRDLESEFGTVEKQRAYLDGIAHGSLEGEGLKREWAERVELVVDESGEADGVSSTEARGCVVNEKNQELGRYVGEGVKDWILRRGIYREH